MCSIYEHHAHWEFQNFMLSAYAICTLQSGNISRDMLIISEVVVLISSWNCELLLHPSFKSVFYSNWARQLFVWSPSHANMWSSPGLVMKICLNRSLIAWQIVVANTHCSHLCIWQQHLESDACFFVNMSYLVTVYESKGIMGSCSRLQLQMSHIGRL